MFRSAKIAHFFKKGKASLCFFSDRLLFNILIFCKVDMSNFSFYRKRDKIKLIRSQFYADYRRFVTFIANFVVGSKTVFLTIKHSKMYYKDLGLVNPAIGRTARA